MGASLSVAEDPDFISAQQDLRTLKATLSDYPTLKTRVADIGSAAAGSLNYDNLAAKITEVDAYNRKIADKISDSPGKLGDSLNQKMADNANFIAKIGKLLEDNTKFTDSLAATLTDTSKTYRTKITGPKGDSGELSSSAAAVKDSLYNKKYTVWCADGDVCQLPVSSKGFSSSEDITLTPKTAVNVAGKAKVTGRLDVLGDVQLEDIYANKSLYLAGNARVGGGLNVNGAGGLNVVGAGGLNVVGPAKFQTLSSSGDVWGAGLVRGDTITAQSRLNVLGSAQFEDMYANKGLSLGGALKIGGWILEDDGNDLRIYKDGKGILVRKDGYGINRTIDGKSASF
jgi:hypothetical protein